MQLYLTKVVFDYILYSSMRVSIEKPQIMNNLINVANKLRASSLTCSKIKATMTCILVIFSLGISFEVHADSVQTPIPLISSADAAAIILALENESELFPFPNFAAIEELPEPIPLLPNLPKFSGKLTSRFGVRKHPVSGKIKAHNGMDIAKPMNTPIYAAHVGRVIFSGWKRGYGYVIEVLADNGYSTLYAHNSRNVAKVNDEVSPETIIGYVGATGVATGPHMHIEVRKDGKLIDPSKFLF